MIKLNVRKSNVYVVFFPRIAQEHIFSRSSPSSVSSAGLRESCSKINLLSSLARVSRRKRARACQTASATCCKARTRWCSRGRCAGVRRPRRARAQRRPEAIASCFTGCRPVKPLNCLRAGLPVVVEADERFFCAMSGRLLTEPVRHSSGVTCDRLALNDWFSAGGPRRGRQLTHHLSRPACMLYIANGAQCLAAQDDQLF